MCSVERVRSCARMNGENANVARLFTAICHASKNLKALTSSSSFIFLYEYSVMIHDSPHYSDSRNVLTQHLIDLIRRGSRTNQRPAERSGTGHRSPETVVVLHSPPERARIVRRGIRAYPGERGFAAADALGTRRDRARERRAPRGDPLVSRGRRARAETAFRDRAAGRHARSCQKRDERK